MFGRWKRKTGIFYKSWKLFKRFAPYDVDAWGKELNIGQGGGAEGRAKRREQ